jgi:hypothetical protein
MRPGTLCVIEPTDPTDCTAPQLAGLIVVTGVLVQGTYWTVKPPAMVNIDGPWMDAAGVQPGGVQEVAVCEDWLRPLDGSRQPIFAEDVAYG